VTKAPGDPWTRPRRGGAIPDAIANAARDARQQASGQPSSSSSAGNHSSTTFHSSASSTDLTTRPCQPFAVRRHSSRRPGSRPWSSVTQQWRTESRRVAGEGGAISGDGGGAPGMRSWGEGRSARRRLIPPATAQRIERGFERGDTARPRKCELLVRAVSLCGFLGDLLGKPCVPARDGRHTPTGTGLRHRPVAARGPLDRAASRHAQGIALGHLPKKLGRAILRRVT
jgi:hypothetical protein